MRSQLYFSIILVCLFLTGVGQALADTPKFSLSVYGGLTHESLELPAFTGVSSSTEGTEALGLGIGYAFNESLSLEFDMVKGGIELSLTGPRGSINDEMEMDTMALYLTSRTSGDIFLKLKYGVITQDISSGIQDETNTTGSSYGLGVGYRISQSLSVEAEYVRVDQDGGWMIASGRFSFGG